MRIFKYPQPCDWADLVERPHMDVSSLNATVNAVLQDVKTRGDEAVREYEEKFDHAQLKDLAVSQGEMDEAERLVSAELKDALVLAHGNIERFHAAQDFKSIKVETMPGVTCWQKSVPIEKVGLYIPGGTAPLFSTVLMLATPAKLAGCEEIVLCTPPNKELAKERTHRESGTLYSWWHSASLLHGTDVGHTRQAGWMRRDCALHSAQ